MKDGRKANTRGAIDPDGASSSRDATSVSARLVAKATEHLEGLAPHERAYMHRVLRRRLRSSAHLRALMTLRAHAQRPTSIANTADGGNDAP